MSDFFADFRPALESPAETAFAVTPNDETDLAEFTRALFIGGAGAVAVTMVDGAEVTFAGLAAGQVLPVRVRRVKATGTTATSIVGMF